LGETCDIVIVGAGPAGSLAAKTAAEKGFKTVFLERGSRVGCKSVGGELLPLSVFEHFPWMLEGPLQRPINRWSFNLYSSDGKLLELGLGRKKPYGYTVHRTSWDLWVSKMAENAGAKLKTSSLVSRLLVDRKGFTIGVETSNGEKIYGSIVIGADGVNSTVARLANLRGRWKPETLALCIKNTYRLSAKEISRRFSRSGAYEATIVIWEKISRSGYGWIFPSISDFCVGFGATLNSFKESSRKTFQKLFETPTVREKAGGARLVQYSAHLIPLGGVQSKTFGNGVLLTGDAAGFPCPMEGSGYETAALTGILAAEVACEALSRGDVSAEALSTYEKRWRESWISQDLEIGLKIQRFLLHEVGVERFNRFAYGFLEALTKHGSYMNKGHLEALTEFLMENGEVLNILVGSLGKLLGGELFKEL
jgi:electron transfer flavoprotein-quinone oxidoreductase